jgi:hypothetical protein
MSATVGSAPQVRHWSRPGRRVVIASSLADLRGPIRGTIKLPIWLYWSGRDRTFDLEDREMRRWLYQIVLREASSLDDLVTYVDGGTLIAIWPELCLPKGVWQAWEERHPALRVAATGSA